ncbi:MAG: c-type cytochrome [Pseudomonadales bacterium]
MMRSVRMRGGFIALCTVWMTGGMLAAATANAADAAAGQTAYAVCAACHGPQGEGNVALGAPRLAGQQPWYLKRQLDAFKAGIRGTAPGDTYGMQMRPMAMTLDEAGIDNVIAYIGTFPDVPAEPTITGDAAAGQTAYAICAACHGPKAEGMEQMGGPRLAGQDDWYLVRQLKNYQQDRRGYHATDMFGKQMKPMAAMLSSDQAINDIVAYINTLR